MTKAILKVLNYFSFFSYPPTFEEIYTFLPIKTTKEELKKELEHLVKEKKLLTFNFELLTDKRYTVGEYGINKLKVKNSKLKVFKKDNQRTQQFLDFEERFWESKRKLNNWRFKLYIKLLSLFPQIKLVGLSGTLSMMNAKKEDDIDLFIITAKNRLFTGRFIAVFLAELLGLRRRRSNLRFMPALNRNCSGSGFHVSRYTDKVCLNLFFDEKNLQVPQFKQSEYVAHEVLQMKPIINKDFVYERFLEANKWVFRLFPNAKNLINSKFETLNTKQILNSKFQNSKHFGKLNFLFWKLFRISCLGFRILGDVVEFILKKFQLFLINRHRTNEIITNSQLWFHPDDFEKKIKLL